MYKKYYSPKYCFLRIGTLALSLQKEEDLSLINDVNGLIKVHAPEDLEKTKGIKREFKFSGKGTRAFTKT